MPTCGQNYVILASYCRHIDFKLHLYISFKFVAIKLNACQYLYLTIYSIYAKMPTCRQNDVIWTSRCRQIDFSILQLYISFKFVTI